MKNSEEIEKKVEIKRRRLEVDYGLTGSNEGNKNSKLYLHLIVTPGHGRVHVRSSCKF